MGAKYREDIGGRAVVADRRRRRWRSLVNVPEPEAAKIVRGEGSTPFQCDMEMEVRDRKGDALG